ncbi:MAG: N-acetyl-gamma-glutamyl-phosphate reductase [Myxococcales bacterium]|nr:N-acetyl-gamma-glutamyl-phosphate reductase [Myxococcales bacterium]
MERTPVAIVGASGYVGAELVRLLVRHPHVLLRGLYAHRHAGHEIAKDYPQFAGIVQATYEVFDAEAVARDCEIAFLALPHGESARAAEALHQRGVTVLDLSADLRLRSAAVYAEWYGDHHAPSLLPHAVYGLVERHREALRTARLVAVPGCYPTAAILALAPLLDARLIAPDGIIIDAKSGTTGAGREPQRSTHFSEIGEGVRAYKVAGHRHTPEIEQELERAAGKLLRLTFTPHLIPMTRGILATCYALPVDPARPAQAYADELRRTYADEPFVTVVDHAPDTAHLRGSNRVQVAAFYDARTGRVIVMGAIDNLVKGAAGQAVQCLNVLRGWPETTALDGGAIFP